MSESQIAGPARDQDFLAAAHAALDLASLPEVEEVWEKDSVLPRMSVGMLTAHLVRQVVISAELLAAPSLPAGSQRPVRSARQHYDAAPWVRATSLDDPAMDRTRDEAEAAQGFVRCLSRGLSAYGDLHAVLDAQAASSEGRSAAAVIDLTWQEWALPRPDFLLTRMVEIVVHSDDLARSVGVPTPSFSPSVLDPVLHLLTDLSVARHGQAAVISALSRAERGSESISAF